MVKRESSASLRIFIEGKKLSEVEAILNASSDFGHSQGELNGKRVESETLFGLRACKTSSETPLEPKLLELIDWLKERDESYSRLKNCEGFLADIFCEVSSTGDSANLEFQRTLIHDLAYLDLELLVSFYSLSEE